jgi:Tfp pilus assembly protein PilN
VIRIDLSRDGTEKSSQSLQTQLFDRLKLPKLGRGKPGGVPAIDSAQLTVIGIAAAAAFLPSLFVGQYKQYVIAETESQVKAIRDSITQANHEIAKLMPYQKELESYDVQKKLVKERLEVIHELVTVRGTPVSILDAVGQSLPPRTWLQSIGLDTKNGQPVIEMAGQSYATDEVSDFVDKLSDSVFFGDVTLQDVGTQQVDRVDVKAFTIIAHPKYHPVVSSKNGPGAHGAPPVAVKK